MLKYVPSILLCPVTTYCASSKILPSVYVLLHLLRLPRVRYKNTCQIPLYMSNNQVRVMYMSSTKYESSTSEVSVYVLDIMNVS